MTVSTDGDHNYEYALRAIGRHLDSETGFHARITEIETGFTVQFQPVQGEERTSDFAWERLHDLLIFNSAGRGIGSKRKRNAGMWAEIPGGREDVFRALGHMLDEEGASEVSLDEKESTVVLTYLHPDRNAAERSHTQHMTLTVEQMRDIQANAQARRNKAAETAQSQ